MLHLISVWLPFKIAPYSNTGLGNQDNNTVWLPFKIAPYSNQVREYSCAAFVWLPFKIAPYSNFNISYDENETVWLPFKIAPYSNRDPVEMFMGLVWLPFKIAPYSNISRGRLSTNCVWLPFKIAPYSNLKSEYFYAPHASIQRTECNYLYYSIKSYSDNDFAQIFVNQSDKFFVCFIFQSIFQKKETNILQLRLIVKTFQILFV